MNKGSLMFFCGKIRSRKSTKSKNAQDRHIELVLEDEWLKCITKPITNAGEMHGLD